MGPSGTSPASPTPTGRPATTSRCSPGRCTTAGPAEQAGHAGGVEVAVEVQPRVTGARELVVQGAITGQVQLDGTILVKGLQ